MNPVPSSLLQSLVDLSIRAGTEIMAIYATDFSAKEKGDLTPVTEADEAADESKTGTETHKKRFLVGRDR